MKTISVIIPAYNEEKRLEKTLNLWMDFIYNSSLRARRRSNLNIFYEIASPPPEAGPRNDDAQANYKISQIIVVDDGSSDSTVKIAESFKELLPIKTIKISENKGKGNAVKAGVAEAAADLIFICDADAAVMPEEINKLLFYAAEYDIVIGSRTMKGSETKMSFLRRFVGFCFHAFCFPLIPGIKDASCGAKLFKKEAAKKIFAEQKINRFAFDIEILWLAKKLNFKTKEVGVVWREIPGSKVKIFGDGLEMFISVIGIYKKHLLG